MINLKLFANDWQQAYAIVIFVLCGVLLIISILEIRRIKSAILIEKSDKSLCRRLLTCEPVTNLFRGVPKFELINVLMILMVYIDLGLKYGYDSIVWDKIEKATSFLTSGQQSSSKFEDFTQSYLFYEALSLLDTIILFMMSLSVIKYSFYWLPSLEVLPQTLTLYISSTVKRIFYFVLLVSLAFGLYCHLFYSYASMGFFNYAFTLIRTNLLLLQGSLFQRQSFFLIEETPEEVYQRVGWVAAMFNMGVIHFFGRYIILTVIVAFMCKDIEIVKLKTKKAA